MSHIQSAYTKLAGIEAGADVTDSTNVAAAGAVMDADISQGEGMIRKTGVGAYEAIKTNLSAVVAPDANDDSGAGYAINSTWIDVSANVAYVCVDASPAAAVWKSTSGMAELLDDTSPQLGGNLDVNGFTVDGRDPSADGGKLDGIESGADVTDSANVDSAGAVMEADFNANTILAANDNDTPLPLTVPVSTLVGRAASGNIDALAPGAVRIVITPVRSEVGATYAIAANDFLILVDASSNNVAVSLPAAPVSGQTYQVKRIDGSGNTVTIDTADAALIDGNADHTVGEYDSYTYVAFSTNWFIT